MTPLRLLPAVLLAVVAANAEATVHRVLPGTSWDGIAANAKPGDEIVLEPGVHAPGRIVDLAGEPGRPIVIRARDDRSLAEIDGGPHGVELIRSSHVEVRNLFIRDSTGEGVAISGDEATPARGILLRNCLLARCGVSGRRPAFRFHRVEGLTLADSRVQGFGEVAISIDRCREIRLERIQVISGEVDSRTAIEIGGGTEGVEIDRAGIGAPIRNTFTIGLAGREAAPAGPLASRVTIRNVLVERNRVFALLGSAREIDLRRNTIIDPLETTLLVVEPPEGRPAAAAVRFRGNLVSWTPNTLKRLTSVGAGSSGPPDVEYGANLWHSAELPSALPLLGGWEGRVAEPQVTDLDPRLDNVATPREPRAKSFGLEPLPRPDPAAGRPPDSPAPAR